MNQQLAKYLKYGIFNNVLYFPYNKNSINKYINELAYLRELIQKENPKEIIQYMKKENSNIFIISFVATILDIDEEFYDLIRTKIKNRYDMYVLINFLRNRKKFDRKLVNRFYQDKMTILGDYKELLFDICRPRPDTQLMLRKRNKIIFEIKQQMDTGEVNTETVSKIQEYKIHPSEIGYYMSYYFDTRIKEMITLHYLKTYGVLEVLPRIDIWFMDTIPSDIVDAIEEAVYDMSEIEDIVALLILYKKIKNEKLKSVIYDLFTNYVPQKTDKKLAIHVIPTQKSGYKIDREEKYDFLYLIGINSVLLDAEFNSQIYINNVPIEGTIMEKLNYFNEHQITLKPKAEIDESKTNILFSNIVEPGFDIIWDITAEKDISFKNIGPLVVKGRGFNLIACLFKYLKEN
jgi:hypothetical protein